MANVKTLLRMKKAAKLVALGLKDQDIADHIGLTHAGFITMKQSVEFKVIMQQTALGIVSDYDQLLSEDLENVKESIKDMVPDAIQAIADAVTQKVDPKLRLTAAETILDRHGIFVKSTRQQTTAETDAATFITTKDDDIAANLANAQTSQTSQTIN
jgi:predicted transcriptional regulator